MILPRLDILIEGGTTLSLKFQILTSFASPSMQENSSEGAAHPDVPEFVLDWIRKSLQRILELQTKACPLDFEDGRALANATAFLEKLEDFCASRYSVSPHARKQSLMIDVFPVWLSYEATVKRRSSF